MWFHLDAAEESSGGGGGGGGWRRRLEEGAHVGGGPGLNSSESQIWGDGEGTMHGRSLGSKHHRYWFRRAGVAMADSPTGPFRFVHALEPDGLPSLDLQLFEETDGKSAFLIRSVNNE